MILSIKIIAVLVVLLQILYWNVIFRKVKEKKGAYPNEKKVTLIICVKNDWNKIKANQLQFKVLGEFRQILRKFGKIKLVKCSQIREPVKNLHLRQA